MLTVIPVSDIRRHVALIDQAFRFATRSSSRRRAGRRTCASLTIRDAPRRGEVVALPISFGRETFDGIQAGSARPPFGRSVARGQVTENECEKEETSVIRTADTKIIARELHARYDRLRAVTLIGRTLQKALFAGRSDDVVFWALVYAHYRGGDLCAATEEQLNFFAPFIVRDPSEVN